MSLPIYWGNKYWNLDESDNFVAVGELEKSDSHWIDYEAIGGESSDLQKESHPDCELRRKFQAQIIREAGQGIGNFKAENPSCVLTHGGIASGKTSAIERFLDSINGGYLHIDFDQMKRRLPEFQFMTTNGIRKAAEFTQEESAKLAGKLLKRAIGSKANLIYEGSLATLSTMKDRIRQMRRKNYEITVISTFIFEATGQRRAVARFERGGRFVPPERVAETYKKCPSTLVELKNLVDILLLFNNEKDDQPVRQILGCRAGKIEFLDKELYGDYLLAVGVENGLV